MARAARASNLPLNPMADQVKQIRFEFTTDSQSLNRIKTAIREIQTDLAKLVQTANSLNLGGGGRGNTTMGGGAGGGPQTAATAMARSGIGGGGGPSGGLAQTFIEASKAMKDMSGISRDALRAMSDSVRRSMDEQKRSISSLDGDLAKLTRRYQALQGVEGGAKRLGINMPGVAGELNATGAQMVGVAQQRQLASQGLSSLQGTQASLGQALAPNIPGAGGGAGGGAPGPSTPASGPASAAAIFAAMAATVQTGKLIGSEVMGLYRDDVTIQQRRGDLVRGRRQAMLGGDMKLAYMLRKGELTKDEQMNVLTQTGGLANVEQGSMGFQANTSAIGGGLARFFGSDAGKARDGLSASGSNRNYRTLAELDMAQNGMNMIEGYSRSQSRVQDMEALDMFQSQMGSRIRSQRIMGDRGLGAIDPRTGKRTDAYGARDVDRLASQYGISADDRTSAAMGMISGGGAGFARANAGGAALAASVGLGNFSGLLTAAGRAGGGNTLAYGALGGGINSAAGLNLGQAIVGSGFDPTGTTSGLGLMQAAQAGGAFGGGIGDFRTASQLAGGIGVANSVLGGTLDAYQAGRNLSSAINIRPGGDVYSQDYLANGMNLRQMADAGYGHIDPKTGKRVYETTPDMEAMGISRDEVRRQLDTSLSSPLRERIPGMDPRSPMGQAVSGFQQSGLDLPEYLETLKGNEKKNAVRMLGSAYHAATGMSTEESIGAMGIAAGLNSSSILKLGGVGAKLAGPEGEKQEKQIELQKEVTDRLLVNTDKISGSIAVMKLAFDNLKGLPADMDQAAKAFIASIMQIKGWVDGHLPPLTPEQLAGQKAQAKIVEKRMNALP